MNEKYWVAFSSDEEQNSVFIRTLYEHFGDIKKAYEASRSELNKISGLSSKHIAHFMEMRDKIDIDRTYDEVIKRNISILTFEDKRYPELLKNIYNPPMVIYYKGELFSCNFDKTLAIVGSRRMSYNAASALKKIISGLSDIVIVSGLAAGVDTAAHGYAIDYGLKTIGVIASGFDFIYPASNKQLYEEIIDGKGAVITEYYPTFEPLKFRFPQRNRIVSGLSHGTIVVEAALKSGALITANLTLEQGRELMCIPGLITNPNTEGIYKLIKSGAAIVTEPEDVFYALNWQNVKQGKLFTEKIIDENNLTIDEKKILYTIDIEPKSFDEIQKEAGLSVDSLLTVLTALELKGKVEQTIGDRYKKR